MQSLACLHNNALIKRYQHSLEYISYQGYTFPVDLYELYMNFNIIKCIIKKPNPDIFNLSFEDQTCQPRKESSHQESARQ